MIAPSVGRPVLSNEQISKTLQVDDVATMSDAERMEVQSLIE